MSELFKLTNSDYNLIQKMLREGKTWSEILRVLDDKDKTRGRFK